MTKSILQIDRNVAAQYGREALDIGKTGVYISPSGKRIELREAIAHAAQGTRSYPPEIQLPEENHGSNNTMIEVLNETTLFVARKQLEQNHHSVVLNFASATSPGGGFLQGARAQEEYLARSSCLYECIRNNPMYGFHRQNHTPLYTDYVLYSPDVPVFRTDFGRLMEEYYTVGIITSAAVNARHLTDADSEQILPIMWKRILKVLSVGLYHQHDAIVLGAWGCGAFANDPKAIASLFHKALFENFRGAYRSVSFAIADWSEERRFIGPFEEIFNAKAQRREEF